MKIAFTIKINLITVCILMNTTKTEFVLPSGKALYFIVGVAFIVGENGFIAQYWLPFKKGQGLIPALFAFP